VNVRCDLSYNRGLLRVLYLVSRRCLQSVTYVHIRYVYDFSRASDATSSICVFSTYRVMNSCGAIIVFWCLCSICCILCRDNTSFFDVLTLKILQHQFSSTTRRIYKNFNDICINTIIDMDPY
jgi:hypothetical protein